MKIAMMGMFMDGDGIPLAFLLFPVNANEQTSLKPLEEKVLSEFGCQKFIYCSDAGLSSEKIPPTLLVLSKKVYPKYPKPSAARKIYIICKMGERSTQVIFCDISIPKQSFNIYDELKAGMYSWAQMQMKYSL